MPNFELLIAKLKERRFADQEAYSQRLSLAASHGVDYDESRRPTNLRLLRAYFHATQDEFATLVGVSSQPEYSKVEGGSKPLSASRARQIEKSLGIAENWLDRNNAEALFLSLGEIALISELRPTGPDAALALAKAIKMISTRHQANADQ